MREGCSLAQVGPDADLAAADYHNQFWSAFDPDRNWPEIEGTQPPAVALPKSPGGVGISWATLLKRRFEAFLRGDVPNLVSRLV